MPLGLIHSNETKRKISVAAKRTMQQSNAGFRQRVFCKCCGQIMSPANLGKHYGLCVSSRGLFVGKKELSVRDIKNLRRVLRPTGWSVQEYVFSHKKQSGKCALCGKESKPRRLSADHCHITKKLRGLLCLKCNAGLGMFGDDISLFRKAIKYLNLYND